VDQRRALNAGVAEANMMALGEAFAALGYNAWTSTFCPSGIGSDAPHRRRAPGADGVDRLRRRWLSEGHGLDLTMMHRIQLRDRTTAPPTGQ